MKGRKAPILIVSGLLIATLLLYLWRFQEQLSLPPWLTYTVQVVSGNWSPDYGGQNGHSSFLYLCGCIVAVLLNVLTIGGVLTAVRKIVISNETTMKIRNALTAKDVLAKDEILASLSENQLVTLAPIIEKAFRHSAEIWEKEVLPEWLGKEGTSQLLALLNRDIGPN